MHMRRDSRSQMPLPSFAMLAAGSVESAAAGGLVVACSTGHACQALLKKH